MQAQNRLSPYLARHLAGQVLRHVARQVLRHPSRMLLALAAFVLAGAAFAAPDTAVNPHHKAAIVHPARTDDDRKGDARRKPADTSSTFMPGFTLAKARNSAGLRLASPLRSSSVRAG